MKAMMNLAGLNMMNSMKAGADQRSKSSSSNDSSKESFKDLMTKKDEQPTASSSISAKPQKTEGKAQEKVENKSESRIESKSQKKEEAKVEGQANEKDAKSSSASLRERIKEDIKNEKVTPKPEQGEVGATSIDANALPGAPMQNPGFSAGPMSPVYAPDAVNPMAGAKLQGTLKDAQATEQVDALTRRVVWNDFLKKMNEELGVSAEEVLGAFSSLTEEELAAPPQQNIDKLVMALGLTPQERPVAQKLFTDLIDKTQSKSLGAELASNNTQINLSLMTQRELQRRQLQRSLEKMNSQFFMTDRNLLQKNVENKNSEAAAAPMVMPPIVENTMSQQAVAGPVAPNLSGLNASAPTIPSTQAANAKMSDALSEMEPVTEQDESSLKELLQKVSSQQPQEQMNAQATANAAAVAPVAPAASSSAEASAATAKAFAEALGLTLNTDNSESEEEPSMDLSSQTALPQNMITPTNNKPVVGEAGFIVPTQTQAAAPIAVPDLIEKARIMVKDGGGEMKVTLSPEGMGEVAMKVSVNKGHVSVEMITESDEAKKMIERGIVDLKSHLTANQLSVDSIKVDTASSMGRQLEQQYQDAQRHQAQQFLEQFRQDTGGWRRNFFDMPSTSVARSQSQGGIESSNVPYSSSKPKGTASRRLDLVA